MKQDIQDKIGSGISGVITPQQIFDAVGNCELGFYFSISEKKWSLSDCVPSALRNTAVYPDVVIDLEHDTDISAESDQFGEDWTITDYIRDHMSRYESFLMELTAE